MEEPYFDVKKSHVISSVRRSNTVYPYLDALKKYENEVTSEREFFLHLPRGYDRDFSSFLELHTLFTCTLSPFPPGPGGHHNTAAVLSPVSFHAILLLHHLLCFYTAHMHTQSTMHVLPDSNFRLNFMLST